MSCENCKVNYSDYYSDNIYTWCTNCGNYAIHAAVKRALVEESIKPKDVLLCFDIGCHGNGSDKIGGYRFHGLHGRIIPFACGASLANNKVKVIAFGGDGSTLGEGINHLIHAVRTNFNITFILHNNANYGLTTGQASPTTKNNIPMNSSPDGTEAETINVCNMVLNLNPSFVARCFSGNVKHTTEVLRQAINHRGFSFVEILQDCPTYNKETPHNWYLERLNDISQIKGYDSSNLNQAIEICKDLQNKIAVGVLYKNKEKLDYYNVLHNRVGVSTELVDEVKNYSIKELQERFI